MDAGFASLVRTHLGRMCVLLAVAGLLGAVAPSAASAADTLTMRITAAGPNPTSGPLAVTGVTNRAGSVITVTDDQGVAVCTATGDTAAVNGWYLFRCAGTLHGGAGRKTLTVKARGPKGNSVAATLTIDKKVAPPPVVPLAVTVDAVSPNPTTGPVTVTGTTTRPSASITVRNQDGSLLCSTTGAASAVGVDHAFTCSGEVTGKAGLKTLTFKVVGPNGNSVSTTAQVTKTVVPQPPAAFAITVGSVSPSPTTGRVTVSGTTNRAGAVLTVVNQDNSPLCTAAGSVTKVGGAYSFSCSGDVTGRAGTKTLVVKGIGPNGASARTTVQVTKV